MSDKPKTDTILTRIVSVFGCQVRVYLNQAQNGSTARLGVEHSCSRYSIVVFSIPFHFVRPDTLFLSFCFLFGCYEARPVLCVLCF